MLGDYGYRYGISGRVCPSGPLTLDKGHWAASALGHAWVFNQQVQVVDLVTGTKGLFPTTPNASNRVVTRWGPGYQLGAQGASDYIATLVSAADCKQGNVAVITGFSNYTVPPLGAVTMIVREPQSIYTYGSADPVWVVEADSGAVYWDNGNAGGLYSNTTGPGGGQGVNAFLAGRDNLNIVATTDNGTTAGTNFYINNTLMAQGSGSTTLQYGTGAAATDSIQFGNSWGAVAGDYQRCCLHFVYVFKRALSAMEIASLSANPYQMWVSENITPRFWLNAGGNVSLSLTGTVGTGAAGTFSKEVALLLPYCLGPGQTAALRPEAATAPVGTAASAQIGALGTGSVTLAIPAGTTTLGTLVPQSTVSIPATAATGAVGVAFLGQGVTPPGTAATAGLGTLSTSGSVALASAPASGVLGTMQGNGSIALYTLGLAATGATAALSLTTGSGVVLNTLPGTGTTNDVVPELAPRLFGAGGTGRIGSFTLSGILSNGNVLVLGKAASGAAGDFVIDSQAAAQLPGALGKATVGALHPSLPGVWTKPRRKTSKWAKEF